jgi:excisionase family DNA binding protein
MTPAVADRREPIIAPTEDLSAIAEIDAMFAAAAAAPSTPGPMLVGPDGITKTPIPEALYEVLARAAADLAMGHGVVILPYSTQLTTQQAADMLNVSRPTLIALLEEGQIPFTRVRSHRRIQLADLIAYQRRHRAEADRAREQIVARAQELGVYDDYGPAIER